MQHFSGTLPIETDGEVNKTVCIVGLDKSCSKTLTIKVKNCGGYRVYYLVPAPQTSTGYCIGNNAFYLDLSLNYYLIVVHAIDNILITYVFLCALFAMLGYLYFIINILY